MQLANPENFKQFVQIKDCKTITTSETVAKVFGKRHSDVLRAIETLLTNSPDDFTKRNFAFCLKNNSLQNGKPQPYFEMTKNGFVLLVMGFTGKKAVKFKIAYIEAFDYMAKQIAKGGTALLDQYYQAIGEHKAKKCFASLCGKGLREWRGEKQVLEATIRVIENKMQIELPLLN